MSERAVRLAQVHDAINKCRACESFANDYSKPSNMRRGDVGDVVVIGESPGPTEVTMQAAFSGPSGKRLNKWLIACGAPEDDPRRGVYLTSVVKCHSEDKAAIAKMSRNCFSFLAQQIDIIAPKLVITLGEFAYDSLATRLRWNQAVAKLYDSRECWLISPFAVQFKLMVWPHPSGLSQWINEPQNKQQLTASFDLVRATRSSEG